MQNISFRKNSEPCNPDEATCVEVTNRALTIICDIGNCTMQSFNKDRGFFIETPLTKEQFEEFRNNAHDMLLLELEEILKW